MALLQFAPLESAVDPAFWTALAQSKLDTLRLSEAPLDVGGAAPRVWRVTTPHGLAVQAAHACSGQADSGSRAGYLSPAARADLASPLQLDSSSLQAAVRVARRSLCAAQHC